MAFVYDGKYPDLVHDDETGVRIRAITRFEDLGPDDPIKYGYQGRNVEFEFGVMLYREYWDAIIKGVQRSILMHTATYVIEHSIPDGLRTGLYKVLKADIKDGIWALDTRGGDDLKFVPDFRVEFVNRVADVPKRPPRPVT